MSFILHSCGIFKSDSIQKAKWYKKAEGTSYRYLRSQSRQGSKSIRFQQSGNCPPEIYDNYDRKWFKLAINISRSEILGQCKDHRADDQLINPF